MSNTRVPTPTEAPAPDAEWADSAFSSDAELSAFMNAGALITLAVIAAQTAFYLIAR